MNLVAQELQPSELTYRLIPLGGGRFAKVDPEDFDYLMQWPWVANWDPKARSHYAVRRPRLNGRRLAVYMAREVMKAKKGQIVDHINHDTLDNRKSVNLRFVTHQQNCWNQRAKRRNTSGHKGVHFDKRGGFWYAAIRAGGEKIYLGRFPDAESAGVAYSVASKKYHGEFACAEVRA